MNDKSLDEPAVFFRELGGLHDADIVQITWDAIARTILLHVDDLNSNFDGLPEYRGREEAAITFKDVESLMLSCDSFKRDVQRIYKIEVAAAQNLSRFEVSVQISPSGRLTFICENMMVTSFLERNSKR